EDDWRLSCHGHIGERSCSSLGIPIVGACQHSLQRNNLCFRFSQLFCPFHTCTGVCTRSSIAKLCVARGLFTFRLVPVVPSFGANNFRHFGIEKNGARKRSPRTSEISPDRC